MLTDSQFQAVAQDAARCIIHGSHGDGAEIMALASVVRQALAKLTRNGTSDVVSRQGAFVPATPES